jgi:RimK family alpha-L-glutamate ligase
MHIFGKKRILIIVGGKTEKVSAFQDALEDLPIDLTLASFSDLNYLGLGNSYKLKIGDTDIKHYDVIYIRMIGKRLEDASLLASYAKRHRIKLVDSLYKEERMIPSSIAKSVETRKLLEVGIPMPKTIYGSLEFIRKSAPKLLKYPYILKSTSGRKAREVWLITDEKKMDEMMKELLETEKHGIRYFGQEYIKASQRIRALVIGGVVVGAITRPTKWRKIIKSKITKKNPEGIKSQVFLSKDDMDLALRSAKTVSLEICGVDIIHNDDTGASYIIEANAAPSWKLIAKDCGVEVEKEILKYLLKI